MIDLHTHTVFSDGALIPAELARRAEVKGIIAIGMTDHVDMSNYDFIIPRIKEAASQINRSCNIKVVPGVEITHVSPGCIGEMVDACRKCGAGFVIVHGETIVEPVARGTNKAAIEAGADILAHPGLISEEDAILAAEKGVFLEISARKGHSLTNGHVAAMAKRFGVKLLINTDAHMPGDLIDETLAKEIVIGAGLRELDFHDMQEGAASLVKRVLAGGTTMNV